MTHTRSRLAPAAVRRLCVVVVAALLGALALTVVTAAPAQAAARLTASSSLGGATASSSGSTSFTVSGSGYQSIEGGFGGVYVAFGWVSGSNWGPSKGGSTGRNYDYVPDEQSKNNAGYQAFVAFPGSSTGGEAQATMSSSGSFQITLTVPGPTFTGAGGKRIDCLKETCGFFTFGAHGVRNATNETFTPVTFQAGGGAGQTSGESESAPAAGQSAQPGAAAQRPSATARTRTRAGAPAQGAAAAAPATGGQAQTEGAGSTDTGPADDGAAPAESGGGETGTDEPGGATGGVSSSVAASIQVDRKAARAGGVMAYAAYGFWPGEQVYVVFGDGDAAVGPVIAGVDGEIAGVLALPEDLEAGTHEIRAAGAGSGLEATERFAVRTDITPAASSTGLRGSLKWVFLALAALALMASAALLIRRRQKDADAADAAAGEQLTAGDATDHYYGQAPAYSGAEPTDQTVTMHQEEGFR